MIISILLIAISLSFMLLKHPLSLGMNLLIQTLLISMITGMMSYNYWFSYIIFLIMIGGMLILFIYMTSIASNEKFKFSYKILMIFSMLFLILSIIPLLDFFFLNNNLSTLDLTNQNSYFSFKLSMNKFLNMILINNLYLIILYLLITLIMVVKITNFSYGPLRQKF